MSHIVLLGGSIFDNKAYVAGSERDVVSHLREIIPSDWRATLAAIDGSVVENVEEQLPNVPADATHIFISAGGNDALMNADVLQLKVDSAAKVFDNLADRTRDFELSYHKMLAAVFGSFKIPLTLCTIYFPNFPDASAQKISTAALVAFNDVIIRQAVAARVPLLDLRLICNEKSDYANEIEPSDKGGRKIAAKIFEVVSEHDFSNRRTSVYS